MMINIAKHLCRCAAIRGYNVTDPFTSLRKWTFLLSDNAYQNQPSAGEKVTRENTWIGVNKVRKGSRQKLQSEIKSLQIFNIIEH